MPIISVGHTDTIMINYLDKNGNPMLVNPTLDSPPVWAITSTPQSPTPDAITYDPSNTVAVMQALDPGSVNVSVTVKIGGKAFSAQDTITIDPAPQVVTSISLNHYIS